MNTKRWRYLLLFGALQACASVVRAPVDSPSEAARHKAALATVVVFNATTSDLTIAFRSASQSNQEIVIGRVGGGEKRSMAPVPAGEPIILIARTSDRSEFRLAAQSLPLDAEWVWQIPTDTRFQKPAAK